MAFDMQRTTYLTETFILAYTVFNRMQVYLFMNNVSFITIVIQIVLSRSVLLTRAVLVFVLMLNYTPPPPHHNKAFSHPHHHRNKTFPKLHTNVLKHGHMAFHCVFYFTIAPTYLSYVFSDHSDLSLSDGYFKAYNQRHCGILQMESHYCR